jgi:carboxymethylenebutenolidase
MVCSTGWAAGLTLSTMLAWGTAAGADSTVVLKTAVVEQAVTYLSGPDTVKAVLFYPPTSDISLPAVLAIHEWWGLSDWVKESARRIAEAGYVVLAIDLYRGKVTQDPEEAHELMRGLPEDRATRDLKAAVAYLHSRNEVDKKRIGSVGWCMGGGYSLQTALNVPDLAACVMCYGRLVTEDSTIMRLHAPVFGIFGSEDKGIPPADVMAFQAQARKLGKQVTMNVYEGVGHAFMNPNNVAGYNEASAQRAWASIMKFFDTTLRAKPDK